MNFPPFRDPLLGPGMLRDRLTRSLGLAKKFFDTCATVDVLRSMLADRRECFTLIEGAEIDHVGLILPPGCEEIVREAATESGFDSNPNSFPSIAVARELTQLAGGEEVPTTIFKAWGTAKSGRAVAVEAFIPSTTDERVNGWIAKGIGSHVAVDLSEAAAFHEARRLFPAAGLRMPAFMNERPMYIPNEAITLMYFDLSAKKEPGRLELRGPGDLR